jgi:hypothetical protein
MPQCITHVEETLFARQQWIIEKIKSIHKPSIRRKGWVTNHSKPGWQYGDREWYQDYTDSLILVAGLNALVEMGVVNLPYVNKKLLEEARYNVEHEFTPYQLQRLQDDFLGKLQSETFKDEKIEPMSDDEYREFSDSIPYDFLDKLEI